MKKVLLLLTLIISSVTANNVKTCDIYNTARGINVMYYSTSCGTFTTDIVLGDAVKYLFVIDNNSMYWHGAAIPMTKLKEVRK